MVARLVAKGNGSSIEFGFFTMFYRIWPIYRYSKVTSILIFNVGRPVAPR